MKTKNFSWVFLVFNLLFFIPNAEAALELELTQGSGNAIPITVLPFQADSSSESVAENVNAIVNQDLKNSGRFRLVDASDSEVKTSASLADYNYWRQQKTDAVVFVTASNLGGKYKLVLTLHDIYGKTILLQKDYTVSSSQARVLAHHISDAIFEKLTGIRGVFSTKIAYVLVENAKSYKNRRYNLVVADADGFNPQTLLTSKQPIMSPSWSPDGKRLAYVSFEGNRAAIYVQDLASGGRQVLSKSPGINGAPAWSPDGRKMALVLSTTGDPKIYIFDLGTRQLTRVTDGWSLDTEPSWTPDGRGIIFTSNRGGGPQIYKLDLASRSISRLTYDGSYNARAFMSKDGKSMVMLHQDGDYFTIAMQDLSSGRVTKLTQATNNESPSLAPNGYMVVYATNNNGRGMLAEVSADAKVQLYLPSQEGEVQEPAWGPFN